MINSRPLGVRSRSDDDLHAITPNDLLLGRVQGDRQEPVADDDEVDMKPILSHREELLRKWWGEWYRKVFPTLLPRKKWHTSCRNVRVGDIALLYWEGKLVNHYRLVRVSKVFPDPHRMVRTVTVVLRARDRRERLLPYKTKPLTVGQKRLKIS